MKSKFTLSEIKPRIFLMDFEDSYDLTMHFLRYQEYYESDSPEFRGHSFEIFDFMKWYSSTYGDGAFTYPIDWSGFNIPGSIIKEVIDIGISDPNKYDAIMKLVYDDCHSKSDVFYLIGVSNGDELTTKHEIAHGFFFTTPEYKKEMIELVENLKPEFTSSFHDSLNKMGYTHHVYVDEIQAYLSTGDKEEFDGMELIINDENKPFVEIFNKYYSKG